MKRLLFGMFVVLTDPAGHDIWIVKSQVVAIIRPVACAKDANAQVITLAGMYCIAEDQADAARKIDGQ